MARPAISMASISTAFVALVLATTAAYARDDPAEGLRLARQWCSACHLVEGHGTAVDGAPPFESVARDPEKTPSHLKAWLAEPHWPMPSIDLNRQEIDDLVAYITSLQSK